MTLKQLRRGIKKKIRGEQIKLQHQMVEALSRAMAAGYQNYKGSMGQALVVENIDIEEVCRPSPDAFLIKK